MLWIELDTTSGSKCEHYSKLWAAVKFIVSFESRSSYFDDLFLKHVTHFLRCFQKRKNVCITFIIVWSFLREKNGSGKGVAWLAASVYAQEFNFSVFALVLQSTCHHWCLNYTQLSKCERTGRNSTPHPFFDDPPILSAHPDKKVSRFWYAPKLWKFWKLMLEACITVRACFQKWMMPK